MPPYPKPPLYTVKNKEQRQRIDTRIASMQEFRCGLYDPDATEQQLTDVSQELDQLTFAVESLETQTAQDHRIVLNTAQWLERMEQTLERLARAVGQ